MSNEDGLSWRANLKARDTIARKDDLHTMVDRLNYSGREALRVWFRAREKEAEMDDETQANLHQTKKELDGLLPWLTPMELKQVVKIVRAIAMK